MNTGQVVQELLDGEPRIGVRGVTRGDDTLSITAHIMFEDEELIVADGIRTVLGD